MLGEEPFDSPPGIFGVVWIWLGTGDSQQRAKNRSATLSGVHESVAGVWILVYIVNYAELGER